MRRSVSAALLVTLALSLAGGAGAQSLRSAPALPDLSTAKAAASFLRSLGIDPARVVLQRGRRNYAGPSCPGKGWTCTTATNVVQISAASGSNSYTCTGSGGPPPPLDAATCTITQIATGGASNTASCVEQYVQNAIASVTQSCVVSQTSERGNNVLTVVQEVLQGPVCPPEPVGATDQVQDIAQSASLTQTSSGGDNAATVSQTANQCTKTAATTGVDQRQHTNLSATLTQAGPDFNLAAGTCSNNGRNSASVTQTQSQYAYAPASATGSQVQENNMDGHVDQCSKGKSAYDFHQLESLNMFPQTASALSQRQFGPQMGCCTFQGINNNDTFFIEQLSEMFAGPNAAQLSVIATNGSTSGTGSSVGRSKRNGDTDNYSNSANGGSFNTACFNGVCAPPLSIPTGLTYIGGTTSDYHDPATFSATIQRTDTNAPVKGLPVTFTRGPDGCVAISNASGVATCTDPSLTSVPNAYTLTVSFAGLGPYAAAPTLSIPYTVTPDQTILTYTGPRVIANGLGVTLTATLTEDDGTTPVQGATVTFTVGSGAGAQTCSVATNASGLATCTSLSPGGSVNQPLGPGALTAGSAATSLYEASPVVTRSTVIFGYLTSGTSFVIGDLSYSATDNDVTFWGSSWGSANPLSGGSATSSFAGFSNQITPSTPPYCGGTWTSSGGNSPPPTSQVPSFMAVVVTDAVKKKGSVISGAVRKVIVVQVTAYSNGVGGTGTGTVTLLDGAAATVCG
jgi:hypothetical protein